MPRIDGVVLELGGIKKKIKKNNNKINNYRVFKPHLNISSLLVAHLHLAVLSLCGNPQGQAVSFISPALMKARQTFVLHKSCDTFVFYKGLSRAAVDLQGPLSAALSSEMQTVEEY